MTITAQDLTKDPHCIVGQIIAERYHVQQFVAQGGMAWIYKVHHRPLKRPMALKLLFPHLAVDRVVRGRFISEAEIQFRMQHDAIVRVVELLDDGDFLGMVQEWIDGPDLKQYLIQGKHLLSPEELRVLLLPLLDALAYAHGEGIIHRDLKPGNVMLTPNGPDTYAPKLGDFGIAKFLDDVDEKTTTGSILGTFKYTAPEQIKDSKKVDHRVDIYAMGVMMYQLAVGHVPFRGGLQTILYQHMHEVPPHPTELNKRLPPTFGDIIMRCLEKNPSQRYSNCRELQEAIAQALPPDGKLHTLEKRFQIRDAKKTIQMDADFTVQLSAEDVVQLKDFDNSSSVEYASEDLVDKNAPQPPPPPTSILTQPLSQDPSNGSGLKLAQLAHPQHIHPDDSVALPPPPRPSRWPLLLGAILLLAIGLFGGLYASRYSKPTVITALPKPKPPKLLLTECTSGQTQSCYTDSQETRDKGACKSGQQSCIDGKWSACVGQILPKEEICNNQDDDCNGKIDENFPQKGQPCYANPDQCKGLGTWQCTNDGQIQCKADPNQTKRRTFSLYLSPEDVAFTLEHKRYTTLEAQKHICFPINAWRGNLTLSSPGYELCVIPVKKLRQGLRLKMKKKSFLEESPDYCLH
ncbi:serine/threonine protein kinase [Myxococcota bacterium]|nr:serine/threonine protein kinase [Myxococcota bacterium]